MAQRSDEAPQCPACDCSDVTYERFETDQDYDYWLGCECQECHYKWDDVIEIPFFSEDI